VKPSTHTNTDDRGEMLELLNAYLDGELSSEETRAVESRLTEDAVWAGELHRLERAWDFLDQLPRAEVAADFTQTTVEMIAMNAAEELAAEQSPQPHRRWIDRTLFAMGAVVAAVAGFLLIDQLRPRRDDELLRAAPVLQHLDLYVRTDPGESADFLRRLRAGPPLPDASSSAAPRNVR